MHGHGVLCGTPRTWEERAPVGFSAADCAGVHGCFAPVRRAQGAAPCTGNSPPAGPCAHPAAVACLKLAPVPAAAAQVLGRPGSGSAAQAGAQAATSGSVPAPGDLRSASAAAAAAATSAPPASRSACRMSRSARPQVRCCGNLLNCWPSWQHVCEASCRGMALMNCVVCVSACCALGQRALACTVRVHAHPCGCMHDL